MAPTAKIRAKARVLFLLLFGLFLLQPSIAFSQDDKEKDGRTRKEQMEKQEKKKEEAKKAREKAKEKHMEMQSKRTKKDLKKLNRRSNRWNRGRRKFFLVRWYERIRYELRKNGGP